MKNLTIFYFFVVISYAAVMGFAQVIFVRASDQISKNLEKKNIFHSVLSSEWLLIGTIFYIFATIYWLWILYKVDIRYAYPIASTSVAFTSIVYSFQSGSMPSINYWIGLLIIFIGLVIVVNSKF
jgi:drug/metabolite transporter (DMT)-like permease